MNSFKHIISYACDKRCSYCINEILTHNEKQNKNIDQIAHAYKKMKFDGYNHIMLSGGEPVLNKMFSTCLLAAALLFDKVSIISAHKNTLSNREIDVQATDVLYSFHHEYLDNFADLKVEISIPVYASMVVETYNILEGKGYDVVQELIKKGFSGMTIREMYPDGQSLPDIYAPEYFSVRTYTKENCVSEEVLLLPDLSLTTQKEFA